MIVNKNPDPRGQAEDLRLGTRRQYTSPWTKIIDGEALAFAHGLGEVPWTVSVIRSEESDGRYPVESSGDVTIAYIDLDDTKGSEMTHIKITNNVGSDEYFQVRAM